MIKLFLDIETLPGEESLKEDISSKIGPPGTYKKGEKIREWEESEKPPKVEAAYRNTALKGEYGRILCIGYIKETDSVITQGVITGSEPEILEKFWDVARDVNLFIGYNILDFDLKFIIQRSIIDKVKPSREFDFARYRSYPIYDVMHEWAMWSRDTVGLDTLTIALGFESPKTELDGSKVYDYHIAGRDQEIFDYCMRDVEATRKIYNRMNFIE